MADHPIKLILTDDLERRRVTVFFRLILAIPLYIWFIVMSIAAFFAAVFSWFATLASGQTPAGLHGFLARYVKLATQIYAYVHLAAEPYPSFEGADGYPVDVEIAPPAPQSRAKVLFRLILAIPAAVIVSILSGNGFSAVANHRSGSISARAGLLVLVAVFAWFVILVRGRAQRGLRDTAAYCLAYAAQFWGYMLLLTDRYPDSDPLRAVPGLPQRSDPVQLSGEDDLRRSRLTVFFRLLLTLPHFVWLFLWSIAAFFAVIANWFAALFTGRSPEQLHTFLSRYLRYGINVYAFLYILANPFPGFDGRPGGYPLDTLVAPSEPQNRWKVLFRLPLALPALALTSAYGALVSVVALFGWFAALVTSRMPQGLRNAGVLALRYHAQSYAYLMVLGDSYPYTGPCLETGAGPSSAAAAPQAPPPAAQSGDPFATAG